MNEKDSIMEYSLMLTDEEKTNTKDTEEKVQENKKPFEEAAEVLLDNQQNGKSGSADLSYDELA